jgi:hypothetical protein
MQSATMLVREARAKKTSLPPLTIDFDLGARERGNDEAARSGWGIDVRLATSLAAIALAIFGVIAIALIGHMTHPTEPIAHSATRGVPMNAVAPGPLLNYGKDIPTPAINLPKDVIFEPAPQ